jgi:hypothetical protein
MKRSLITVAITAALTSLALSDEWDGYGKHFKTAPCGQSTGHDTELQMSDGYVNLYVDGKLIDWFQDEIVAETYVAKTYGGDPGYTGTTAADAVGAVANAIGKGFMEGVTGKKRLHPGEQEN